MTLTAVSLDDEPEHDGEDDGPGIECIEPTQCPMCEGADCKSYAEYWCLCNDCGVMFQYPEGDD